MPKFYEGDFVRVVEAPDLAKALPHERVAWAKIEKDEVLYVKRARALRLEVCSFYARYKFWFPTTCLALIPEEEKDLYLAIWELQER